MGITRPVAVHGLHSKTRHMPTLATLLNPATLWPIAHHHQHILGQMIRQPIQRLSNVSRLAKAQRLDAVAGPYVDARQQQSNNLSISDTAMDASATIGGQALNGASGVASINQASGHGNATLNVVTATLAQQGIRESDDDSSLSAAFASAGQQHGFEHGGATSDRRVASVESTALQGFEGVLQLNQVAGSGNDTGNTLVMSIQAGP